MIVTDLDGTLLNSKNSLSKKNRDTLVMLGEKNITRVVATGRVLHSAEKVLSRDFPIDYLVFSSGAGVLDYKTKKLLKKESLSSLEIRNATEVLIERKLNFMMHAPTPSNHFCIFYKDSHSSRGC